MNNNHNVAPYYILAKERAKLAIDIEMYEEWDKDKVIDSCTYTIEKHLKYLNTKKEAFIKAMKILEEHGMGLK